jgi:hypothetical protein
MCHLKALALAGGIGMVLAAIGILTYDLALEIRYRSAFATDEGQVPPIPKPRWRTAAAFAFLGWAPLMIALGVAAIGIF